VACKFSLEPNWFMEIKVLKQHPQASYRNSTLNPILLQKVKFSSFYHVRGGAGTGGTLA
jgi:hypothetical protein